MIERIFTSRINQISSRVEQLSQSPIRTTDLFFRKNSPGYISPDAQVLVVGPGVQFYGQLSLPMDNSLAVLPPYLAKHGGNITVLDAPMINTPIPRFGDHGINSTKRWIDYLAKLMPVCPVQYVEGILPEDVFDPNIKFSNVNDHLTTDMWIMNDQTFGDSYEVARQVIRVYKAHLKPEGKINMFYRFHDNREKLRRALIEEGFKINEIPLLIDHYDPPAPLKRKIFQIGYESQLLVDHKSRLKSIYPATGILIAHQ